MSIKLKAFLFTLFLLFVTNTVGAELLLPAQVGERGISHMKDMYGEYLWTITADITEQVTINNKKYFHWVIKGYSEHHPEQHMYFRSTDSIVYFTMPDAEQEIVMWQIGVEEGTTWETPGEEYPTVVEFIGIEPVNVPYFGPGVFHDAYVYKKTNEAYKQNGELAPWYEYLVPGIGMVKGVDEYNPEYSSDPNADTLISELVNIIYLPTSKSDCKNGGWQFVVRPDGSAFKNQGDCIQYVNTGK